MPQITHVRTTSKTHPKHITAVLLADGTERSRSAAVNDIDKGSVYYYTRGGGQTAYVETVHPRDEAAYIRTRGDSTTADNLLNLPPF
jgi:hypothetical protein